MVNPDKQDVGHISYISLSLQSKVHIWDYFGLKACQQLCDISSNTVCFWVRTLCYLKLKGYTNSVVGKALEDTDNHWNWSLNMITEFLLKTINISLSLGGQHGLWKTHKVSEWRDYFCNHIHGQLRKYSDSMKAISLQTQSILSFSLTVGTGCLMLAKCMPVVPMPGTRRCMTLQRSINTGW